MARNAMTFVPPHLIALAATIADDWGVFVFIAALALVAVFVGRWVREWEDAPPDQGESGRLGEHQKRQCASDAVDPTGAANHTGGYVVKRFMLFLVFCVALTSCSTSALEEYIDPCNLEEHNAAVELLLEEWDDAVSIANLTSRVSLPNVLSELQGIRRRTKHLEIQECFEDAHPLLVKYMDFTIEAFMAFLGDEHERAVSQKFDLAQTSLETYLIKLGQAVAED